MTSYSLTYLPKSSIGIGYKAVTSKHTEKTRSSQWWPTLAQTTVGKDFRKRKIQADQPHDSSNECETFFIFYRIYFDISFRRCVSKPVCPRHPGWLLSLIHKLYIHKATIFVDILDKVTGCFMAALWTFPRTNEWDSKIESGFQTEWGEIYLHEGNHSWKHNFLAICLAWCNNKNNNSKINNSKIKLINLRQNWEFFLRENYSL